jgi:hypothetical protein
MTLKPGVYRHYKGNEYLLIGPAKHSETLEDLVVYKALYGDGGLRARPTSMFCEDVVVNGKNMPRFEWVRDEV